MRARPRPRVRPRLAVPWPTQQLEAVGNALTCHARLDLYFRCNGFGSCNDLLRVGVLVADIAEAVTEKEVKN